MKKVILATSMIVMGLMAADYSQMTTEELNNLRGTVATEDRDAFRAEMQSRMQAMTPEERQTYRADRGNKGQGPRDGSGKGKMNKGNNGAGGGMKQGANHGGR